MQKLRIEATTSTPEISFDSEKGTLEIKGESYPENTKEFYKPVFEWLDDFFKKSDDKITVNLRISYLNTSSLKAMMTFFDMLDAQHEHGRKIEVNWFYNPENEVAMEVGEEFEEDVEFPFNIIAEE